MRTRVRRGIPLGGEVDQGHAQSQLTSMLPKRKTRYARKRGGGAKKEQEPNTIDRK